MNYSIFKLAFTTALHAGGKILTDSGYNLYADTIFSALCHEALKIKREDGIEELVRLAREDRLIISDALPYIIDTYFIPNPILLSDSIAEKEQVNKPFKKLQYIPLTSLGEFIKGEIDADKAVKAFEGFGKSYLRVGVNIRSRETGGDPEPYHVGGFTFAEDAGLYIIAGEEGVSGIVENYFEALSFAGIGGKRSAGMGKFNCDKITDIADFIPYLGFKEGRGNITLSVCMAKDDELSTATDGAYYRIQRRSGFVSSLDYAETPRKRADFYAFSTGSSFKNRFGGDVFDLSGGGRHSVYRYAKPFFFGVD
jgi:CRISPR-associated protein Csm4